LGRRDVDIPGPDAVDTGRSEVDTDDLHIRSANADVSVRLADVVSLSFATIT